ncbi:MAG: DNA cytosine methyltransferase [Candidatus Dormibacteraeota bacterium]|nr:DNA cytosine methyltransferase [Candidatus Dormibacteraeota bacterium]
MFTGAGGLDLGLEAAGFKIAGCVEIDADARKTIALNRPDWPQIECGDIHAYDPAELLDVLRLKPREMAVLSAGPPCQPFSKSGYWANGDSKRMKDPRAETLKAVLALARVAQPDVLLIENVAGLSYSGKDEAIGLVKERLAEIDRDFGTDYDLQIMNIRAEQYGVPQKRHRVFLVATRDGAHLSAPTPTHRSDSLLDSRPLTTWDAIGDLDRAYEDDPQLRLRGKWADLVPSVPEGANYQWHTDRGGGLPLFGWRTKYWTFLLKLAKSLPAWTIQAEAGPSTGPFHWKNRLLSVEELCRLQTLPGGYRICGADSSARRQVGNAVPAAIGELLGLMLREQIFGEDASRSLSLIPAPREDCPEPEHSFRVARKYFALTGNHSAHPGTGLGPRALTWADRHKAEGA